MTQEVLAALRAAQQIQLDESNARAYVYSRAGTQDAYGEQSDAVAADPSGNYPCITQPSTTLPGREQEVGGEITDRSYWNIILPWNAVVDERDQIEIRIDGGLTGDRFEVIESPQERSNRQTLTVNAVKLS